MNDVSHRFTAISAADSALNSKSLQNRRQKALELIEDEEFFDNLIRFGDLLLEEDIKDESIVETYYHVLSKLSVRK